MYLIRCPHCDDRTRIPDDWHDTPVECGRCHKYFLPAADEADNTPATFVKYMRDKTKPLVEGLKWTGILGALLPAALLTVFRC